MTDADLTRLPTGEMGWAALVAYAAATDDRVERYFLEVKSDVDLTAKSGRAKVAKFILGAANRDPALAARRFGGHAIMLLGIGRGATPGISPFEAQDLARDVAKWIGVDGPTWDFERIQTGEAQDVIAVIVDPPSGQVWTCRADGDGLADGDIYVRGDGNTRKATGDEVRAMLTRAVSAAPDVDVKIEVIGEVIAVTVDHDFLKEWIDWRKADFLRQIAPKPTTGPYAGMAKFAAMNISRDTRSQEDFRAEVEAWHRAAASSPTSGIVATAGRVFPGIRLRVKNRTKTFLRDVRIDIEVGGGVLATDWYEPESKKPVDLFPDAPIDWGEKHLGLIGVGIGNRITSVVAPRNRHGVVEITSNDPARLVMMMDALRPEENFESEDIEVVLVMLVDADPGEPVSGTWRLTAADVNDVYSDDFTIPVVHLDWRKQVRALLGLGGGDDADEPSAFSTPD